MNKLNISIICRYLPEAEAWLDGGMMGQALLLRKKASTLNISGTGSSLPAQRVKSACPFQPLPPTNPYKVCEQRPTWRSR